MNVYDAMSEEEFKKHSVTQLSNELTVLLDYIVTKKNMTYTQKLAISNFRDRGVFNAIMLGDFKHVTLDDIVSIFAEFKLVPVMSTTHQIDIMKVH